MNRRTVSALAYWIGFTVIVFGTIPANRRLLDHGVNFYLVAAAWFMLVSGFSWSVARWMTTGRYW